MLCKLIDCWERVKLNMECLSGGLNPPGASAKIGRASLRLTLGSELNPVWPHIEHTAGI